MSQTREEQIKEVLNLDPNDAMVHFTLGGHYLSEERYEDAIEPFETAVKLNEKYSAAWLGLGRALYGAERDDDAKTALTKTIEVANANGDLKVRNEARELIEQIDEF